MVIYHLRRGFPGVSELPHLYYGKKDRALEEGRLYAGHVAAGRSVKKVQAYDHIHFILESGERVATVKPIELID